MENLLEFDRDILGDVLRTETETERRQNCGGRIQNMGNLLEFDRDI